MSGRRTPEHDAGGALRLCKGSQHEAEVEVAEEEERKKHLRAVIRQPATKRRNTSEDVVVEVVGTEEQGD